jgi:hypothetical protein
MRSVDPRRRPTEHTHHEVNPVMRSRLRTTLSTILLGALSALAVTAVPAQAGFSQDWDGYSWGDTGGRIGVLGTYEPGDSPIELRTLRVRGPRVSWIPPDYPTETGTVGWRVEIWTSPSKDGPWTKLRSTGMRRIEADRIGARERFGPRSVAMPEVSDKVHVRVVSRLFWLNDDDGTVLEARHRYGRYGQVESAGTPGFAQADAIRRGSIPNRWNT